MLLELGAEILRKVFFMKKCILIATFLSLSACAALEQEIALGEAALDQQAFLVGLTKSELLACAGEPQGKKVSNGREEWTYVYEAYKDPSINRGDFDRNYIGISKVLFGDQIVEEVTFGTNYTRNSFGIPFPKKIIAGLSAPIYRNC